MDGPHCGFGERIVCGDLRQVELVVEQVTPVPRLARVQCDGVAIEGDAAQLRRVGEAGSEEIRHNADTSRFQRRGSVRRRENWCIPSSWIDRAQSATV